MKVFIFYSITNKPFGGANQFMRALRNFFEEQGILTKNIFKADIVLINSHSLGGRHGKVFPWAYLLKTLFPKKLFVHRMDGPVQLYGGVSRSGVDNKTYHLNQVVMDGTIFQTQWSQQQNVILGMSKTAYVTTIPNAPDPLFFYRPTKRSAGKRIKLIAASWSDHVNKGFDFYKELDDALDWSRFSMTFVGRSPYQFRNIEVHEPVSSLDLGELLRKHDIFVTASQNDPCSNVVLEALICDLPVIARKSGGHPDLVREGGELFESLGEAVTAIDKVAQNLDYYRGRIVVASMQEVGLAYQSFMGRIVKDVKEKHYKSKHLSALDALRHIFFSTTQ